MTALTPRQVELVGLIAQGQTNAQIAHSLGITEQTAKNELTQAYRRLGAANRTEAVLIAARQGHVDLHIPARPVASMPDTRQRLVDIRGEVDRAIEDVDALMDEQS